MIIVLSLAMILSAVIIYLKKRKVEKEETTIENGLMHMQIVDGI